MTDSLPGCASSPVPENGYLYSEVSPSHSVGDVDPEEEVKLFQSKPVIPNSVSDVPPELLPFILAQCKAKVPRWNAFRDDEIGVQELCGGLTNKLYKAWVKNARADLEYDQVVIRFFGKDTDMFFERKTELIVAWTLSDNRQGVRVFGTFKEHGGGRLEAFYHGHTLHMQDLHNPALSVKIAASLAKLHTLDIPLERDEARVLKNLTKWFNIARSLNVPHINSKFSHVIFTFERLHDEISFLKRQLPKLNSPVIFCHNDLQEGNIIFDPVKDVLQVIDYEYSAYNYRGFDLANHMCEHYIDYHVDRPPFFSLDPSKHPSKEHQLAFFQAYLDTFREHLQARCDSAEPSDPCHSLLATVSEDTSESLYRETKWFMLSSNLMWGIWSIIQAVKSDIAFGYMEYAHARFSDYSRIKAEVLEEFPLAP